MVEKGSGYETTAKCHYGFVIVGKFSTRRCMFNGTNNKQYQGDIYADSQKNDISFFIFRYGSYSVKYCVAYSAKQADDSDKCVYERNTANGRCII